MKNLIAKAKAFLSEHKYDFVFILLLVVLFLPPFLAEKSTAMSVTSPDCRTMCRDHHFTGYQWAPVERGRFAKGLCLCTGAD